MGVALGTMSTQSAKTDVVIAGGSFVGLALALALSNESGGDLAVTVVAPAYPALDAAALKDVRGSALSRGSLNLLDAIGIWPALKDSAQPVSEIVLTDSDLDDAVRPQVLRYALEGADELALPAMVIVENAVLGGHLHQAAREAKGVRLVAGTTVVAFEAGADGVVVELGDGRTITARLLVAADGARSALRDRAGIQTTGWAYEQTGVVTTVVPAEAHHGRAVQHFLPSGPFALLPMTDNRVCVTWSEETHVAARILALDEAGFRAEVERRFGGDLGVLRSISVPQSWPLRLGLAREIVGARFALVGDAAHMVHPIAGQGLNLGFRDVAALAEAVMDAARLGLDTGQPDVLARYARVRRFDTLASAAGFDMLNRLFSSRSTLARSARGAALSVVDRLPAIKAWLIAEAAGATGDVPRLLRGRA